MWLSVVVLSGGSQPRSWRLDVEAAAAGLYARGGCWWLGFVFGELELDDGIEVHAVDALDRSDWPSEYSV